LTGVPESLVICGVVQEAVASIGGSTMRVSRSQVAFRRGRGFAYVWRPGQYVSSEEPAVLSIALPHELTSGRFKEVVHPCETVWMHHIELPQATEVDDHVVAWLAQAYARASCRTPGLRFAG
jgi:hypothetical protein